MSTLLQVWKNVHFIRVISYKNYTNEILTDSNRNLEKCAF